MPLISPSPILRFASTASKRAMTNFNITVTSDIVCPWCYIGHARLSKAIEQHQKTYPEDKFHLRYLPYYLIPELHDTNAPVFPVESRNTREIYKERYGGSEAIVRQVEARIVGAAAMEGLKFSLGGNSGTSRNGHRLIYYAQNHGGESAQNNVMLGLWKRYFEQEVDITKPDVLVEIGVEAGLGSADSIKEYLLSGKDAAEVDKLAEEQRTEGVSGVPYYVIQNKWAISGGQDSAVFLQVFKKWKDLEAKGEVQSAPSADVPAGKTC